MKKNKEIYTLSATDKKKLLAIKIFTVLIWMFSLVPFAYFIWPWNLLICFIMYLLGIIASRFYRHPKTMEVFDIRTPIRKIR